MLLGHTCASSEAEMLAMAQEEEKQADALEGVEIDDAAIKAALMTQNQGSNGAVACFDAW
jgi:hypothetical protein